MKIDYYIEKIYYYDSTNELYIRDKFGVPCKYYLKQYKK